MKNYSYFFLGIFLPGAINFFAIPIFKHKLGNLLYGEYNILLTTLLMGNMVVVGWVSQSILRLISTEKDKLYFIKNSIWVAAVISLFAAISIGVSLIFAAKGTLILFLFGLLLVISAIQLVLNGAVQSYLHAKGIMYAESVRVGLGFILGYAFISASGLDYAVEKLFLALIISNLLSIAILLKVLRIEWRYLKIVNWDDIWTTTKKLFKYGIYLMLWFLCSYMILYNDRYFIFFLIGKDAASNYTALFDIITRTITMSASPLLMSTFPVLVNNYDRGDFVKVNRILWRILLIELACLPAAILFYFLFGFKLLQQLLNLPVGKVEYFWAGLLILAGSIVFQLGMVAHKKMELRKETSKMFKIILAVVGFTVVANTFVIKSFGIMGAAVVYMVGTTGYLAIVLLTSGWKISYGRKSNFS